METIISDLLKHFERGALTRRELNDPRQSRGLIS